MLQMFAEKLICKVELNLKRIFLCTSLTSITLQRHYKVLGIFWVPLSCLAKGQTNNTQSSWRIYLHILLVRAYSLFCIISASDDENYCSFTTMTNKSLVMRIIHEHCAGGSHIFVEWIPNYTFLAEKHAPSFYFYSAHTQWVPSKNLPDIIFLGGLSKYTSMYLAEYVVRILWFSRLQQSKKRE